MLKALIPCLFVLELAACDASPADGSRQAMLDDLSDKKQTNFVTQVVFRPGDPDGTHANVFTTWQGAYDAISRARDLGQAYLEFDDRFSTPCHVPAGTWDMTNIYWTSVTYSPSTAVELDDGASITTRTVLTIVGDTMRVISNRKGPVAPLVGVNMLLAGVRTRLLNTDPAALPMVVHDPNTAVTNYIVISGKTALGGLGDGPRLPAPLIDVRGGPFILAGGHGFASNNAFTDTHGGGNVLFRVLSDGFTGAAFGAEPAYDFPALVAGGGHLNFSVESRERYSVKNPVTAATYNAVYNELVMADSSAVAVTVNAPRANPAKGERLVVKDVGGNAATNHITVAGTGGDTVEDATIVINGQAKTWVSDGAGKWMHVGTN
jgi:hypothetical protein